MEGVLRSFPLGLVLVDPSWDEAFELFAEDDDSWAGSVEWVRSGAVLWEGWGEPVGVEGNLGSKVACDELLGCLGCELGPLVGPGKILDEVHADVTEWEVSVFGGRGWRSWVGR